MFIEEVLKAGGKVYEVGGSVRDRLLKRPLKDRDLIIRHLSIETIGNILKPFGKVHFVGKSFGVLKFYPNGKEQTAIDIAIPRKEVSTGVGHRDFKVDYDPDLPLEADLGRRDFTINAMALDLETQNIIDPFDGQKDLKKRLLRQVFKEAFIEDPLRLLRAIQFAARFNLTIEPDTMAAMKEHASLISTVSGERIIEELGKLMTADHPSRGFYQMAETGLLGHLFPILNQTIGINQEKQAGDDVFHHTMKVLDATRKDSAIDHPGDLELMFAALFHDIGKVKTNRYSEKEQRTVFYGHQIVSARLARKILKNLHSPTIGVNPNDVSHLIEHHMFETKSFFSDKAIRRFISKIGKDQIFRLIDLRTADNRGGKYPDGIKGVSKLKKRIIDEISRKPPFGAQDLAVSGCDIMKIGVPEGPSIGKILTACVEHVLDEPEHNTSEQLIAFIKDMLNTDPSLMEPMQRRGQTNNKST